VDAVDVMMNPDEVEVTYEPILGAATFQVEGYMVHGQFRGDSLTSFFYDDDVPVEYQLIHIIKNKKASRFQLARVCTYI